MSQRLNEIAVRQRKPGVDVCALPLEARDLRTERRDRSQELVVAGGARHGVG